MLIPRLLHLSTLLSIPFSAKAQDAASDHPESVCPPMLKAEDCVTPAGETYTFNASCIVRQNDIVDLVECALGSEWPGFSGNGQEGWIHGSEDLLYDALQQQENKCSHCPLARQILNCYTDDNDGYGPWMKFDCTCAMYIRSCDVDCLGECLGALPAPEGKKFTATSLFDYCNDPILGGEARKRDEDPKCPMVWRGGEGTVHGQYTTTTGLESGSAAPTASGSTQVNSSSATTSTSSGGSPTSVSVSSAPASDSASTSTANWGPVWVHLEISRVLLAILSTLFVVASFNFLL